jgi:hypothetical protein
MYVFYDRCKRKRIVNASREYFTSPGGYIDGYIKAINNIKNDWIRELADAIEDYRINPESFDGDSYDFLRTKGKGQIETILNTIFGEFTKWYYRPLDIPLLMDNGILGFYNEKTGTCHFVVLTD